MQETLSFSSPVEQNANHKLVNMLDHIHAKDVFGSPESTKVFVDNLDYNQFESFLNRINGICRDKAINDRELDGNGHITESNAMFGWSSIDYMPPATEDRRLLMQKVFEAFKGIKNLEQGATMLGVAINIIHPYNDGNGRTSRFVYSLLTHGYRGTSGDKQYFNSLLTNTEGRKIIDLNPRNTGLDSDFNRKKKREIAAKYEYTGSLPTYVFGGYNAEFAEDQSADNLLVSEGISDLSRELLHKIIQDSSFSATTFTEFLLESGSDLESCIKVFEDGRVPLFIEQIISNLSDAEIISIVEKSMDLRVQYVEYLIDLFTDSSSIDFAQEIVDSYRPKN
jgi:hypothetical protein